MDKGGTLGVAYHMSGLMDMDVEIDIPGKFSVYNSMTAISICRHFGVKKEVILDSLSKVRVKGRVEIIPVSPKFTIMIDYAHNAMSLNSLLTTLKEYSPKRLVCLFGCGGNPFERAVVLRWVDGFFKTCRFHDCYIRQSEK